MLLIAYLLQMIRLTLMGLVQAWPITVVLLIALILALLNNSPFTQKDYKHSYLLILLPSLLTILIMLSSASSWAIAIGVLLVLAHLPIDAFLARQFWEYQGVVLTAGAFQMWVSMVAAFMGSAYNFLLVQHSFD
jgi:hypothetical protein